MTESANLKRSNVNFDTKRDKFGTMNCIEVKNIDEFVVADVSDDNEIEELNIKDKKGSKEDHLVGVEDSSTNKEEDFEIIDADYEKSNPYSHERNNSQILKSGPIENEDVMSVDKSISEDKKVIINEDTIKDDYIPEFKFINDNLKASTLNKGNWISKNIVINYNEMAEKEIRVKDEIIGNNEINKVKNEIVNTNNSQKADIEVTYLNKDKAAIITSIRENSVIDDNSQAKKNFNNDINTGDNLKDSDFNDFQSPEIDTAEWNLQNKPSSPTPNVFVY